MKIPLPGSQNTRKTTGGGQVVFASSQTQTRQEKLSLLGIAVRGYDKVFRVTVVSFLEGFNFCLAGVKRSCIHFVIPDGRIIPFDTYNLLHRPAAARAQSSAA